LDAPNRELIDAMLDAYRDGAFPMADPRTGAIEWFRPDPRAILPLESFHVPHSLRQRVTSRGPRRFVVTSDRAFSRVIRACAKPRPDGEGTWIDDRIVHAYEALHLAGHAHSVEAWTIGDETGEEGGDQTGNDLVLVGGLYGVHVGGLFAGESMFSLPNRGGTDASKVCLVHLVYHLRRRGFALLDVQFVNPHLKQFGVIELACDDYLDRLARAVQTQTTWEPFDPNETITALRNT
jgi:leucyl/phenylalanyl-tRNA---protein transferase